MAMPNDAKLGLLAGVLGVIVAAVVSASRPGPDPASNVAPAHLAETKAPTKLKPAGSVADGSPASPAVLPADLAARPVVRTRKEPDGTAASRNRNDDDIDP